MIWAIVAACFLVSFIFSGVEAGILSVNRIRLKHRARMRDRAAVTLEKLLEQPEQLLISVLFVTNLLNILGVTLATRALVQKLGDRGYLVTLLVFLPVYLFVLELLPKSLFRRFPYRALAAMAKPLQLANALLSPLKIVGDWVVRAIAGKNGVTRRGLFAAREDFKYLAIESERTGAITQDERQMIHSVVDFRGETARQLMVPMEKVRWISGRAQMGELLARYRQTGIDRWPVVAETGEITGMVNIFDIALEGRKTGMVEHFQRRIVKVAPDESATNILRKMRAARGTIAAVVDVGAKPIGIVTWEDLIKRLVS